jgi:hypothetical protein
VGAGIYLLQIPSAKISPPGLGFLFLSFSCLLRTVKMHLIPVPMISMLNRRL